MNVGKKLTVGDEDTYYLDNAVYMMEEIVLAVRQVAAFLKKNLTACSDTEKGPGELF